MADLQIVFGLIIATYVGGIVLLGWHGVRHSLTARAAARAS